MRILVLGDTHGDTDWVVEYVIPTAVAVKADVIVQVGDYGFWEHEYEGIFFNNEVNAAATEASIKFYFLRGNHDNLDLLLRAYGDRVDPDGFIIVRSHVLFVPDGHRWTWNGVRMRAFGGAYSLDKPKRLKAEAAMQEEADAEALLNGWRPRQYAGTSWFPDEEIDDDTFTALLAADTGPVDIMFSHDRPRSVDPGIRLSTVLECLPTQDNLQRALLVHQPSWWLHGHLHHRYTDQVRSGDSTATTVVGLGCNLRAARRFAKPCHAWVLLDLDDGNVTLTTGSTAEDTILDDDLPLWNDR